MENLGAMKIMSMALLVVISTLFLVSEAKAARPLIGMSARIVTDHFNGDLGVAQLKKKGSFFKPYFGSKRVNPGGPNPDHNSYSLPHFDSKRVTPGGPNPDHNSLPHFGSKRVTPGGPNPDHNSLPHFGSKRVTPGGPNPDHNSYSRPHFGSNSYSRPHFGSKRVTPGGPNPDHNSLPHIGSKRVTSRGQKPDQNSYFLPLFGNKRVTPGGPNPDHSSFPYFDNEDPINSDITRSDDCEYDGGARYIIQNYQDAMAICKWAGYPKLSITLTCNPKWPEVVHFVESRGLKPEDRPDILCRIFKVKLDQLINDLIQNKTFGKVKVGVKPDIYFVYEYGYTRKTFIYKTLSAALRSKCKIVLTIASSGSALAELIVKSEVIIWDEAPMMNKYCFEALDRATKDILKFCNPLSLEQPFGGKMWRRYQTNFVVISKESRQDIVLATLNSSYLSKYCKVLKLTKNMKLQSIDSDIDEDELKAFLEWISSIEIEQLAVRMMVMQ
ncbi:hypothetical protein FEM48_Zijuj08G0191100 [Ziziphus jujuba var. spinosa]|uniref:ATP-dependent DNA helicase n=1 Tax=Ziziphus jujuba var. spinosa TaxID=714518 RepID=A0A978V0U9_ZIZJJ|nr:hypothetical protein FEM48_Zijuj08G0191100 [Ziziphus jujuba var. spinosa]